MDYQDLMVLQMLNIQIDDISYDGKTVIFHTIAKQWNFMEFQVIDNS